MAIIIIHKGQPVVITGMEHKHKVFLFKEIQRWIMENEINAMNAESADDIALAEQLRLTNERLLSNCDKIQESIIIDKQPPIYERKELVGVRRKQEIIVSNSELNILQEVYDHNPEEFKAFIKKILPTFSHNEVIDITEQCLWNVGLSIIDVIKE